jgi:hypothetical protein
MAVKDDLGTERRMAGHFDCYMAPVGVPDVKGVMVDERLLLLEVADYAFVVTVHLPDGGDCPGDKYQE